MEPHILTVGEMASGLFGSFGCADFFAGVALVLSVFALYGLASLVYDWLAARQVRRSIERRFASVPEYREVVVDDDDSSF